MKGFQGSGFRVFRFQGLRGFGLGVYLEGQGPAKYVRSSCNEKP